MFFPPRPQALQPIPDYRIDVLRTKRSPLSNSGDPSPRPESETLRQSQEDFGFDFGVIGVDPTSRARLTPTAATFVPCVVSVVSRACGHCHLYHIGTCPRKAYCERCGCSGHIARNCEARRAYNGNTVECTICGRLTHQAHKCRAVYDCYHQLL